MTNAAPIFVPPSAQSTQPLATEILAPTPADPAVPLDKDEMARLIKRGTDILKEGDFVSARLLFKRAADASSAEAALALGLTYDPSVIKQLGAISVTADFDSALKWYGIAADHGSAEAADQFANLIRIRQKQR